MFKQQPGYSEEEGLAFWYAEIKRQEEEIDRECEPTDEELFNWKYAEYLERLVS